MRNNEEPVSVARLRVEISTRIFLNRKAECCPIDRDASLQRTESCLRQLSATLILPHNRTLTRVHFLTKPVYAVHAFVTFYESSSPIRMH
jgi:hypothetical protein